MIGLDSLIISSEFAVKWGLAANAPITTRTVELHSDFALYFFDEPRGSMAKHLKAKLYVEGCKVVDCGHYANSGRYAGVLTESSGGGGSAAATSSVTHAQGQQGGHHPQQQQQLECLALFLADRDFAERVDGLGNRLGNVFSAPPANAGAAGNISAHGDGDGWSLRSLFGRKNKCSNAPSSSSPLSYGGRGAGSHRHDPILSAGVVVDEEARAQYVQGSYVVFLLTRVKSVKWRFLKAITEAFIRAAETAAVTRRSEKTHSINQFSSLIAPAVTSLPSSSLPSSCRAAEANKRVVTHRRTSEQQRQQQQQQQQRGASSRSSSSGSVLSNHEVLKLEDVLPGCHQACKRIAASSGTATWPLSVHQSPLYVRCLASPSSVSSPLSPASTGLSPVDVFGAAHNDEESATTTPAVMAEEATRRANASCADCGASFPTWCVLQPFGSFVCIDCIGVHRRLWPNKCRAVELDVWPETDVTFMASRGNAQVNAELEFCCLYPADSVEARMLGHVEVVKPAGQASTSQVRDLFIQAKYESRLFTTEKHPEVAKHVPPIPDPEASMRVGLSASPKVVVTSSGESYMAAAQTPFSPGRLVSPSTAFPLVGAAGRGDASLPFMMQFPSAGGAAASAAVLGSGTSSGPPQYGALLELVVKELVAPSVFPGAVCVITNGYQELRTRGGRRLMGMTSSTAWDERLQLGLEVENDASSAAAGDEGRSGGPRAQHGRPLFCAIYSGGGSSSGSSVNGGASDAFVGIGRGGGSGGGVSSGGVGSGKEELLAAGSFVLPSTILAGETHTFSIELPFCNLNQQNRLQCRAEVWSVTVLASYQRLR